jgi:hypothetical protein
MLKAKNISKKEQITDHSRIHEIQLPSGRRIEVIGHFDKKEKRLFYITKPVTIDNHTVKPGSTLMLQEDGSICIGTIVEWSDEKDESSGSVFFVR